MTGDESSPVDSVHVASNNNNRSNMHFRPNDDPGEDSTDLHPIGSNANTNTSTNNPGEDEDSSPTAIRLGRFKAYHYATHAHSGGSGFGDPLGGDAPYGGGEHVHHHERRYRTPSGEGDIDYIRGQYSPPPPSTGDWTTSGNIVGHQIPYLEVASQHSPRGGGGGGGGLMVSWSEQQKFNPGSHMRAWSEHDLNPHPHVPHSHHPHHHHIDNSPVVPSVNSTTITPPSSSGHRRGRHHHHHHHHHPDSSSNNHSSGNTNHSGGSTTTSTSSLNESIPDDTLAVLSVKELNKRVQNLAREDVVALKQRRRTLKNRGYAMNCRLRRQQHKETLEVQVDSLKKDNLQLQSEIDFYKNQLKNCRCHGGGGGGNEGSLELPSSAPGPPGSYPHHPHHHPLVAVHPPQLDLSVNPVSSHEDFKRIYSGGPHELKVQPNMNTEDYKKHLELSGFSANSVMSGATGREHLDIKILSNEIETHKM